MNAARVTDLGAAVEGFGDAEGFNVANDLGGVNEVEADGGVGELLALVHINNVGGRRQKAAGLALQRQVLGVELAGGEQADGEEAANGEFVNGAKIHFFSSGGAQSPASGDVLEIIFL